MAIDPSVWLLTPSPAGDGKPWGTGTNMASRAMPDSTKQVWDENCKVTTYIGGYAALCEMRDRLEEVIGNAQSPSASPFGQRGHVYFANFRFNCQRDLSTTNTWKTDPWGASDTASQGKDQTALGLVLRLMQAGVTVRILVWLPTYIQSFFGDLSSHLADHKYLWSVVTKENERLVAANNLTSPIGIVGLDGRTADGAVAGAHHQKMMVIRSPGVNVAFCGGVDLAFTRRDAPLDVNNFTPETVLGGDWQSGSGIPDPHVTSVGTIWPPDTATPVTYNSALTTKAWTPSQKQPSDLPTSTNVKEVCAAIGGIWDGSRCNYTFSDNTQGTALPIYGDSKQYWHDQHLKLEGPIVATLEWQFCERWKDHPLLDEKILGDLRISDITSKLIPGSVAFSTDDAWVKPSGSLSLNSTIVPLDTPDENIPAAGDSVVQMWRTIPLRTRPPGLFYDGEFTVMAGVANAMAAAQGLIWIFDQYFWSEPAARLLNYRIQNNPKLCVLIVLPPHADTQYPVQHRTRQLALAALTEGLSPDQRKRVAVYNMWHPQGQGIYVHAKSHTYDGALLVCGSANMNRRSFTCDTEIACAVLDPVVVANHQEKLWTALFGNVAPWPGLDLNNPDNGAIFLNQFVASAQTSGVFVVADPWDDDNPLNASPTAPALPNRVPRPVAVISPYYEVLGGLALDPGSMRPTIEEDIVDASAVPRPCRLDDVAYNIGGIYIPGSTTRYPKRQKAILVQGQTFRMPSVVYYSNGYHFTDQMEWWKELCSTLPCCLEMGWPGYESGYLEYQDPATQQQTYQISGHDVVLHLWRGWCPRFGDQEGMPGGIGAEFGVYRRRPGQLKKLLGIQGGNSALQQKLMQVLPKDALLNVAPPGSYRIKLRFLLDILSTATQATIDTIDAQMWWPFTELDVTLSFTLVNPVTQKPLFTAGPEKTWWLTKWMDLTEYIAFSLESANQAPSFMNTWDYDMQFTVSGIFPDPPTVWKKGDSIVSFGRI
jgi:PLD-like domain